MQTDYDIIVIGGGLVGTSLVVALQPLGLRIAVLEKYLPSVATQNHKDVRPLSLSYGSKVILDSIGVWSTLENQACAIDSVIISEQNRFGSTQFKAGEQNVPALGYVIPFWLLQKNLYQQAASQEGVEFIAINDLRKIECDRSGAKIQISTAMGVQTITAQLVVAADGTRSQSRDLMHIDAIWKDGNEIARTATIKLKREHDGTAYERFTKRGTLAILPLPMSNEVRLVWTMSQSTFDELVQWDMEKWQAHLQQVFGNRIGAIESVELGKHYPLQTMLAKEQVRDAFVLLGNAAHTLYPVAAQGFNLGLRDVAVLSEVLADALCDTISLGDIVALKKYLHWRGQDQKRIIGLTRSIVHLFGLQLPMVGPFRGLGLLATDLIPSIKNRFAKRTMGIAGKLPRLARGLPLVEQ